MTLARELADTAGRPQVDKNLLINGGMNVWQRSTSTASITSSAYHTVDRWQTVISGSIGTWTQSRSTDVPSAQGFGYSLKMDCTTADASPASGDLLIIRQQIEGQNLQRLLKGTSSSKAVTLSFYVKSNKTGTYICEIADTDNTRSISKSYTISSASTWQKVELTFDGDTTGTLNNDNGDSLHVVFWLGAGSDFTSGTLNTSWASAVNANKAVGQVNLADSTSNEWYITGCQLEIGEAATDFQFEPFETTLRKCMRYYYQLGGASVYERIGAGVNRSSTLVFITTDHPVPMRTTPTLSVSSVSDFLIDGTGGDVCSAVSITQSSTIKLGLLINLATAGDPGGSGAQLVTNNTLDARMKITAEL